MELSGVLVALTLAVLAVVLLVAVIVVCTFLQQDLNHHPDIVDKYATALGISEAEAVRMLNEAESNCPSVIEPRLLLGNAASSQNRQALRSANVTHVVNATQHLPNHFEPELTYLRVPVDDALEANLAAHLDDAVDFVAAALKDEYALNAVLLHCQQGVSRSAAILVAFLMRERWYSLETALATVHEKRFIRPNRAFVDQLRKYEKILSARAVPQYESGLDVQGAGTAHPHAHRSSATAQMRD